MSRPLQLPVAMPTPQQWVFVDWLDVALRSQPAVGGQAVAEGRQLDGDEQWLVDHAVSAIDSPTRANLRLYAGSVAPANLLDGSSSGNFDVADWPAGLRVRPGSSLVAAFTNVVDGAVGTVTAQVRVFRRR